MVLVHLTKANILNAEIANSKTMYKNDVSCRLINLLRTREVTECFLYIILQIFVSNFYALMYGLVLSSQECYWWTYIDINSQGTASSQVIYYLLALSIR